MPNDTIISQQISDPKGINVAAGDAANVGEAESSSASPTVAAVAPDLRQPDTYTLPHVLWWVMGKGHDVIVYLAYGL